MRAPAARSVASSRRRLRRLVSPPSPSPCRPPAAVSFALPTAGRLLPLVSPLLFFLTRKESPFLQARDLPAPAAALPRASFGSGEAPAPDAEHHIAKRIEEQSKDVTADVDTAKRGQDQSNVDAADAETIEQSKVVATDIDTAKRSEESNGVATDLDASKGSEEQSNKVNAEHDTAKRSEE
ncbi:hypothetical protein ZWY2020_021364 [Hordeum vulgare]|nr:hypothetical protein ZWY2020_021364 [Hordeum vulgare]